MILTQENVDWFAELLKTDLNHQTDYYRKKFCDQKLGSKNISNSTFSRLMLKSGYRRRVFPDIPKA